MKLSIFFIIGLLHATFSFERESISLSNSLQLRKQEFYFLNCVAIAGYAYNYNYKSVCENGTYERPFYGEIASHDLAKSQIFETDAKTGKMLPGGNFLTIDYFENVPHSENFSCSSFLNEDIGANSYVLTPRNLGLIFFDYLVQNPKSGDSFYKNDYDMLNYKNAFYAQLLLESNFFTTEKSICYRNFAGISKGAIEARKTIKHDDYIQVQQGDTFPVAVSSSIESFLKLWGEIYTQKSKWSQRTYFKDCKSFAEKIIPERKKYNLLPISVGFLLPSERKWFCDYFHQQLN